jgi:glycosyltransferase involved in cell wall biosynthesis
VVHQISPLAPVKEGGSVKKARQAQDLENAREPQAIAVMIGQLGAGGGSEKQLYKFLADCDKSRWRPTVYVSGVLGAWEEPIRKLGIPVVPLCGSRLAKMWRFRSACIAQKARCFFSWSSYTNGFGLALKGLGIHCIGSFRNAVFADLPTRHRWLWEWISLAGISTIICNSRETQAQIADRGGRRRRVLYVPNGVTIFAIDQVRAWREQWRGRLGLGDDTMLVLGLGRLVPQKNYTRFIDVIAQVSRRVQVQAIIAGDDQGCLAELKKQAGQLSLEREIRFIGIVPNAHELMSAADIFLLTSDHEGMPNVVLEAMAAGVPCVATCVNAIHDLVEHGSTGFIAGHNVAELAKYVARLAADAELRRAMGSRARQAVGRDYRPDQIARDLWKLCEAVD